MDKQGVGVSKWASMQNAQLVHLLTSPTHAYPQGFCLRPDALCLPKSYLILNSGMPNTKTENRGNGDQLPLKMAVPELTEDVLILSSICNYENSEITI